MALAPYSSAECEVLSATGRPLMRVVVGSCRMVAACWAIVATFLVVAAIVAPPVLFVLAVVHGMNPFQQRFLIPLASSALAFVAFQFGAVAIRSYALFVSPTHLIALRFLAFSDLIAGLVFSAVGAAAVYLMWRKPEEKLIYGAYVLLGLIIFPLHHAFRKRG